MTQIILNQSYLEPFFAGGMLLILLFGSIIYYVLINGPSKIKTSKHKGRTILLTTATLILLSIFPVACFASLIDEMQIETKLKEDITTYYQITKDDALLHLKRNDTAPIYLVDKLTVEILHEDKTYVQVKHNNQYDRIPKSYLK